MEGDRHSALLSDERRPPESGQLSLTSDTPESDPPPDRSPPWLVAARAWRYTSLAVILADVLGLALLIYGGVFATPSGVSAYATCASTVADGPCSTAVAGVPCTLRCPPRCSDTWVDSAAFAVYGGPVYRGDSKLCRAAMHSGVLSDAGGCMAVHVSASAVSYAGSAAGGVATYNATWGVFGFTVGPYTGGGGGSCVSLQWPTCAWILLASFVGFALLGPSRPALAWGAMLAMGFVYLYFSRGFDPQAEVVYGVSSGVVAAALSVCVWFAVARLSVPPRTRGAPCLVGAVYVCAFGLALHLNFLDQAVPLELSSNFLSTVTPTAVVVLVLSLILGLSAAVLVVRELHREKLLRATAAGYAAVAVVFALLSVALRSGYSPHVHHVILALLLLPLTRVTTLTALAAQGLLLGVFINGAAFWGLDPPWDERGGGILPAPPCAPRVRSANASAVVVDWPLCPALPTTATWGLVVNNNVILVALAPPAVLAPLPDGAVLDLALVYAFPDGQTSNTTDTTTFTYNASSAYHCNVTAEMARVWNSEL